MNTATSSGSSIAGEIDAHIRSSGIPYSGWYVGITGDINERLFGFHKVPKQGHWFIYRTCANAQAARAVEAAFHKAGCKGATGGGDHTSCIVYAYVVTMSTVE